MKHLFKRLLCWHDWQTPQAGILVCRGRFAGCIATRRCLKCGKEKTDVALPR